MLAIIDGDVLVYRAAYKAEKTFDWGHDQYSIVADLEEARGHYRCMVASILEDTKCVTALVAMSDPNGGNFRHEIYPDYKSSRHKSTARKPMLFRVLRNELIENGSAVFIPNLEGDDVMGIVQSADSVICTIDKDLKGIPGKHYNFDHADRGIVEYTKEEADLWHLTQTLSGDPTDGVPGIPGVGLKTATTILSKGGPTWETVKAAYIKAKLTEEVALTMARLVKILDRDTFDEETGKPILWEPK